MPPLLMLFAVLLGFATVAGLLVLRSRQQTEAPEADAAVSQNLARLAAPVTGPVTAAEFPHMSLSENPPAPARSGAEAEAEPLLTIQVWQLGVLVLGLLMLVGVVVGAPVP